MNAPHIYPNIPGAQKPDTSRAAAAHAAMTAGTLRDAALDAICHSRGLTADQVAERLGQSILSIRPRVTELARLGKLKDTGQRRANVSGRSAIVWASASSGEK